MFGRRAGGDGRANHRIAQHPVAPAERPAYSQRGRRLPGEQAIPTYTPIDFRAQHRRAPAAHRPGRLRLVPALAATLVVPVRLAAPGPHRGHRRPVRRASGPLDAPARDHPALSDPDVGRGARAQRAQPPPGHARARPPSTTTWSASSSSCSAGRWRRRRSTSAYRCRPGTWSTGRSSGPPRCCAAIFPDAVDAELVALDSEVEHLDQVLGSAGLEGRPVTAEEMSWLMHRSCSLGLPAPRNMPAVPVRHLGAGGPGQLHRRRRLPHRALRADRHRAWPHRLQRGHQATRRGAHRRPDARSADPRGRRPVGAARGPPARLGRVVGADLRAQAGGGLRRTPAADEQGPLAGPALHRRARAGTAAVAVPAGVAGAGDRRRDDLRVHRARHPRPVLVAAGRLRRDRARGAAPGPAAAGAVQAEGRHRAPRGPVRDGPRVHPGRTAGLGRLPAARLGDVGGLRGAHRDRRGGRPARHPARRDVHGDPSPGRLGSVDGAGDPGRLRPHRARRRSRWR